MRVISLLVGGAILASCSNGPMPAPMRTADKQRTYQLALQGKVAQKPISCLPSYRSGDMTTIDENTILFRNGSSRVYVNNMRAGCTALASGHYTLVTRTFGGSGLCSGDIAQVVDLLNGTQIGSCVFGDFTPYVRPKTS